MVNHQPRNHIILVPGFAGFDALGEILYYPGITKEFSKWIDARRAAGEDPGMSPSDHMQFHYFKNLPTASVRTRADMLKNYLAKGIARGDFWWDSEESHDNLMLIGHSTGGLDIRQLLYDLDQSDNDPIIIDGDFLVTPDKILNLIKRIIFLSVPQCGTNIANWLMTYGIARTFLMNVVDKLTPVTVDWAPGAVVNSFPAIGIAPNLRMAIEDCVRESSPWYAGKDPILLAKARQAASNLKLYLDGISHDFSAIIDLQHLTATGKDIPSSPAHFTSAMRRKEQEFWKKNNIEALSYATLGNRPFDLPPGQPAPILYLPGGNTWDPRKVLNWQNLSTGIDLTNRILFGDQTFDSSYLLVYRACAGGPFRLRIPVPTSLKSIDGKEDIPVNINGQGTGIDIEQWDNDGIANTLSMLWPNGENTRLVKCDHGDIIGHYSNKPTGDPIRQHYAYDIFVSSKSPDPDHFDATRFTEVWTGIFNECAVL